MRTFILITLFTVFAYYPSTTSAQTRKVIIEDITGSWCGFCPDGLYAMSQLATNFPEQVICIAAHVGDPMENTASDALGDAYSGGGVNVLMLDRYLFDGEQFVQFTSQYDPIAARLTERLNSPPKISVAIGSITYNPETYELSATVTAQILEELADYNDLRLNLWLVEDSVSRSINSYSQVNFYNGYAGHPYFGAGNPIPNFVHQHVLRAALGTTWGTENSLPNINSLSIGQIFTQTYTTHLDPSWQLSRLSLIGLVQNYHEEEFQREILNAEQINLMTALQPPADTTNDTIISAANISTNNNPNTCHIYPNPAKPNNPITINYELTQPQEVKILVYDQQGKQIALLIDEKQTTGKHQYTWQPTSSTGTPLSQGFYTIACFKGQQKMVQRIYLP